jgi:hypothetical protein
MELKADLASPTFTGTPTAPTPAINTDTAQIATTAFVQDNLDLKADLDSPDLTGTPTAPTPTIDTDNDQIATTEYVKNNRDASETATNAALDDKADKTELGGRLVEDFTLDTAANSFDIPIPADLRTNLFTVHVTWPDFTSDNEQSILMRFNDEDADETYQLVGIYQGFTQAPAGTAALSAVRWGQDFDNSAIVLSLSFSNGQNLGKCGSRVQVDYPAVSVQGSRNIVGVKDGGDYIMQNGWVDIPGGVIEKINFLCWSDDDDELTDFPTGVRVVVIAHGTTTY